MKKVALVILFISLFSCETEQNLKTDYVVNKNEIFEVSLISNPTTGYSWKWVKDNSSTRIDSVSATYVQDKVVSGIVGSGGNEIWKFKGKEAGVETLTFEYCRSWDPKYTVETKKITVIIN